MISKPYYVTTPLYYVNAAPHIGHSYTTVAADCIARYHRLRGEDVFFLTGTDEHGEKIAQAAAAKGLLPKAFADAAATTFKSLWTLLGVEGSYTRFIRTTDPDHEAIVKRVLERLQPQLTRGTYRFWYCLPDETSFGFSEIDAAHPVCPTCARPVTQVEEEDYFLELEPHREWLRGIIEQDIMRIRPGERRNEVLGMLTQPLPPLCVTRPKERVSWGIDVPFSPSHVTYVWFDALVNYISALGWPDDARFRRYWNEAGAVHLIGKDIIRHHALYWPIILKALGEKPPAMIVAHGWWKVGEQKMSKSLGNIVDPVVVIRDVLADQPYAADIYRYFLLRDVPFGQDGAFSEKALLGRLQADLANDLGNLVNRTHSMIERYCSGKIPASRPLDQLDVVGGQSSLAQSAVGLARSIVQVMERGSEFSVALGAIMAVASQANRYIEEDAPWKLAKQPGEAERLRGVLATLADVIRIAAITLSPFLPSVAASIWSQLGMGAQPMRLADAAQWPGVAAGQALGAK